MRKSIYLLSFLLFACSSGGSEPSDEVPEVTVKEPQAASLVYPEDNSECEEGELLSETQNRITFIWNEARDTDSYTLYVTQLEEVVVNSYNASSAEKTVTLERGKPYSWYVVSRADGSNATATSATWKFYNAGAAEQAHAPFPAEAIFPAQGATVSPGSVILEWHTADIDGDLESESSYFGASNPPDALVENDGEGQATVETVAATTYYWQVISTDRAGNQTESPVYSFRTE